MKSSISTRMLALIVPIVLAGFIILIGVAGYLAMTGEQDLAYQMSASQAAQYANLFDGELRQSQALGQTLAQYLEMNTSANRQEVMDGLKKLLDQHPEVVGTYVGCEPNAFDGKDAQFANSAGSDASGRFLPYWNKLTGAETLDPLGDVDISDYYLIPERTKANSVIETYVYQGVLMTSFISPILKNGNFVGIAGEDTTLTSWDQRVKKIKIYTSGYAFLVSNTGDFHLRAERRLYRGQNPDRPI